MITNYTVMRTRPVLTLFLWPTLLIIIIMFFYISNNSNIQSRDEKLPLLDRRTLWQLQLSYCAMIDNQFIVLTSNIYKDCHDSSFNKIEFPLISMRLISSLDDSDDGGVVRKDFNNEG